MPKRKYISSEDTLKAEDKHRAEGWVPAAVAAQALGCGRGNLARTAKDRAIKVKRVGREVWYLGAGITMALADLEKRARAGRDVLDTWFIGKT